MSYKFNLKKRAAGKFSVRMRSYKKEERESIGKADVPYIEKTLPQEEWARYGFHSKMTYEQADAHKKILNSRSKQKDSEERSNRFKKLQREENEELFKSAYLPKELVIAFEDKLEKDSLAQNYKKSKTPFHWATAKRVIAKINLDPIEWNENARTILKSFEGYAPSTVAKIFSLMNHYGIFYSKRIKQYYEPLKIPKGLELGYLSKKYRDKTGGKTKEALGISLEQMSFLLTHSLLSIEEKNWCIIALGFGLRPSEVDGILKDRANNEMITLKPKSVIIYQPKLVTLSEEERYKELIIKYDFQKDAVKVFKSKSKFQKPTLARLRKVLGKEYGLYSFRKGYTDIMMTLGEPFERISSDLGHSSVERTWRNYRKKIKVK